MKRYNWRYTDSSLFRELDWCEYSEVEQLQALTKELCEGIVENWKTNDNDHTCHYCIHCDASEYVENAIEHDKDCLVLKAQSYLDKEGV